jgi:hypothetical protein
MLVTPYCKRIRPGRRTTRAAVPLIAPLDPSGLGHAATIYSSVQGPPGVETPTGCLFKMSTNKKMMTPLEDYVVPMYKA